MIVSCFADHLIAAARYDKIPLPEVCRQLRELGLEAVDLGIPRKSPADAVAAFTPFADGGLKCASCYCFADCGLPDDEYDKYILECIKAAKEVGSPYLMIVPGSCPDTRDRAKEVPLIAEHLERAAALAAPYGITITFENFSQPIYAFSTPDEISAILKAAPSVYYTYDSGNFMLMNFDSKAGLPFAARTRHCHFKDYHLTSEELPDIPPQADGKRLQGATIGGGDARNDEITEALHAAGYDGALTVELHRIRVDFAAVAESVKWVKALCDRLNG